MFATLVAHKRRVAVLAAVTIVALAIELVQAESVAKILLSVWLPALVLGIYWSRAGWPTALSEPGQPAR